MADIEWGNWLHRGGDDAVCRVAAPGQQINQCSTVRSENLLILKFYTWLFFVFQGGDAGKCAAAGSRRRRRGRCWWRQVAPWQFWVFFKTKKPHCFLLQFFNLDWFDAIVNSAVQRLRGFIRSKTHVLFSLAETSCLHHWLAAWLTELKKLELSLEGGGGPGWSNVTEDPSLADYLQYFKWDILT